MILGISTFTYGWGIGVEGQLPAKPMTEIDLVGIAIEQGLRCVQIGDNLPIHHFSEKRLQAFKHLADQHGIRIEIGARKLTAENLERYTDLADVLGAPLLRFIIDGDGYEPDLPTIKKLIRDFVPDLRQRGIILGIENHDRLKAKELAEIIEYAGSQYVGVCLDCVNSMGAGEGLEHVSDVLAPFTVNLHVKDFICERLPHKMGFTIHGTPAGKGMTNVPMLIEKLQAYGRCQSAVLEQWVPPQGDITTTIEVEKEWARRGIEYLKTFSVFQIKH